MIEVRWDSNLEPAWTESAVEQWDRWFEVTKDEESIRTWNAAKDTFTDESVLVRWATIIEFNRLDRIQGTTRFPTV